MYNNDNYPLGADTPYAPWNEQEVPEEQFGVCISQTLSKSTEVTTNDYVPVVDQDEDGYYDYNDTSDTDWKKAYENEHLTPLQLIGEFKDFLTKHLPDLKGKDEHRRAKELISECSNWVEDDFVVIEN